MERFEIYEDIKKRTNGDIYIGVVGPVRSGKSMFISRFMQNLVIPNIKNEQQKERAVDELPQSAEGKTIMTTQPKFVPENAVNVHVADVDLSVRLVDCVGYLISGAMGHEEGDKPRLVKTPWSEKDMPFEQAAEIGTEKVITEHSTIGVAITTDGSISDLPRSSYVEAEQKVVDELKKTGKPFVLVVNSKNPQSADTQNLAKSLEKKYGVSTLAINVKELSENDIEQIFEKVLLEFPIRSLKVTMPDWLRALDGDDEIITTIIDEVKKFGEGAEKIGQIDKTNVAFLESDDFEPLTIGSIKMGEGTIMFNIKPRQQLFYKVLPYAYVLGVSKVYLEKFEDIPISNPAWLVTDNVLTLWLTINLMTRNFAIISALVNQTLAKHIIATVAKIAVAATISSIDGDGGFSGGGSGGGGVGRF